MTIEQIGIGMALLMLTFCAVYAVHCAYYNGVNDGYGATVEPWNPGYRKAREYLTKYWGFYVEPKDDDHDL